MKIEELTVLILTHNRPQLFYRAFNAVRNYCCEIIINNDTNDITFIPRGSYKSVGLYHYKFNSLSDNYQFLISKVQTPWFYIVEDDDIPYHVFQAFTSLDTNTHDAICGSYLTVGKKFIRYNLESSDFQLSQVIFKNKPLNFRSLYLHCDGDCIYNDYYLVKDNIYNPLITNLCFFKQTTDGKDNISFPEFSKFNLNNCKGCTYSLL